MTNQFDDDIIKFTNSVQTVVQSKDDTENIEVQKQQIE